MAVAEEVVLDTLVAHAKALNKLEPLLGLMGITRVANLTGLDYLGIPVVAAVRPQSRSLAVAQGKGLTLDEAKISAIMEAAETYHAERVDQCLLYGTAATLGASRKCVDLARLPWSSAGRYDPDRAMLWIEGRDVVHEEPVWLPLQCVHTAYTPFATAPDGIHACTSGLSAGLTYRHAVEHGILEVIERDAANLHRLLDEDGQIQRKVNMASVDDDICSQLIRQFEEAGLLVSVWEISTDIDIAAFACVIGSRFSQVFANPRLAGGYGCHFQRGVALKKALLEAAQSRLTAIAGARDDLEDDSYNLQHDYDAVFDHLMSSNGRRDFKEAPNSSQFGSAGAVEALCAHLARVGSDQVIVVDLTKPTIGIPVVRVVIPGLESAVDLEDAMPGPRMCRRTAT